MTTMPGASVRRPALALLLWAWYTALSLVVAWPFFAWLALATGVAPETDVLREGLHFGALFELVQASRGRMGGVSAAMTAVLGLALLSNAFLGGGLFAVLAGPGQGRLLPRFFEGAGRFFPRSLGLLAATLLVGGAVAAGVAAGAGALLRLALDPFGEPGSVAQTAILLALLGVVAAFFALALDYARVWMVRHDARGFVRTWLRGAGFVLAHPLKAVTPGLVFGALIAATLALAAWVPVSVGGRTWSAILSVLIAQQALLYVRVLLRVGMVGMEGATTLGARGWEQAVGARGWELGASEEPLAIEADGAPQAVPADDQKVAGPTGL